MLLERALDAVPAGRRFAREWIAQSDPDLAADTELIVSELLTNAVLHGEGPILLRLSRGAGTVRVQVEDAGNAVPVRLQRGTGAMTGRGLSLVSSVTSGWGVISRPDGGKAIWADLVRDGGDRGAGPPDVELHAAVTVAPGDEDHAPRYTVRLGAVPTDLLVAAKSHVDNVVRELTLLEGRQASGAVALGPAMAALVATVTRDFAETRNEIKRQAAAAATRGQPVTDLELHLPLSAASAGELYIEALDEVDRHARSAHLLTLASPPLHGLFRRWYVRALVGQLRAQGAGATPPPPPPFSEVLAGEATGLAAPEAAVERPGPPGSPACP